MTHDTIPYFVDTAKAPMLIQMPGLETTILTGLHGERMMMALNATLPGHTVPMHSHPHEQLGMVYVGKALLRVADEERIVQQGDFYCIPANVPHGDTCLGGWLVETGCRLQSRVDSIRQLAYPTPAPNAATGRSPCDKG